ncbi:5,6-dimethylbenzimidazole synthase [Rhodococcus sp. Leaf7]|uniref:5,6-dimethylbenzimidazole synthase n=1 Tax=unclassified Rhodococcus (in: high G+C Gram-positive bacteria) TaxID=192944 RepID=UPI0006F730CD|nr:MULTISPECIES: 5,6-dimethylbenzimidazole synthase [unclassified Rhodococcus (in: high G+C Gram-positive bacteria)]KQU07910.1 5,6-dimethylbenzimidazole synthase [Rhodococcus sp. Leaf7]KQU43429.1 5,6-dimethylbenzimidazole synthase [Rhodococcus sp. Leaf247]
MSTVPMSVHDAIAARRDVRAEFSGEVVADDVLERILTAAHRAPSVGNTQPWDFVIVRNEDTLTRFAAHVAQCRADFAASLPADRAETFDPIRVEGIVPSGTGIVVTYDESRGGDHVLGRATVRDTGLLSVALAIENLWLAGVAEGIGVGWVSFYDEEFLRDLIGAVDVRPVAWLCVGPVTEFQEVPDLERFGWRPRRALSEAIHHERWGRQG